MYKIAIVEDDDCAAGLIRSYCEQYFKEHPAEFDIDHFTNGVDFISDYHSVYDIVLLDIEMPMMDGMEAARRLREIDENVVLIFATNMANQAIQGYEVNAIDFLVKPVSYFKFEHAFKRAIYRVERLCCRTVTIKSKEAYYRLSAQEIIYVEVYGHFLYYYTSKGKIEVRGSLLQAEKELEPMGFARCNDCYLVNLRSVVRFNSKSVWLSGCEEEIPVSRRRKNDFFDKLTVYVSSR